MSFLGVNVTTIDSPIGSTIPPTDGSTYFVVGRAERGAVNKAVQITSMSDYANKLGSRVPYGYLFDDLTTFFAEGGKTAYVARVVGPSATAGSVVLVDANAAATLQLVASSPGAWSSNLTVEVVASGANPQPGGFPNTFTIVLRLKGQVVEQFTNVASPAAAAVAMANSNYVTVTNRGSLSVAPANNPVSVGPAGVGTALSAGDPDAADITTQSYLNAASTLFTPALGCGVLAFPGQSPAAILAAAIPIGSAGHRITIASIPQGQNKAQAEAIAVALATVGSSEYGGLFWPWPTIPDGFGGTYTVPPDGFVAGTRARTIKQFGTWRANFGQTAAAQFVVGTELGTVMSDADAAEVYSTGINPIRIIANRVELYGWESLSSDPNFHFLTGRDVLDFLAYNADLLLEQYVGQTIDATGKLFTDIAATLVSLVQPLAEAGGLFPLSDATGNQVDPGYAITSGFAINPVANLAEGVINVSLGVRISPAAQMINLVITKVGFTASAGGGS